MKSSDLILLGGLALGAYVIFRGQQAVSDLSNIPNSIGQAAQQVISGASGAVGNTLHALATSPIIPVNSAQLGAATIAYAVNPSTENTLNLQADLAQAANLPSNGSINLPAFQGQVNGVTNVATNTGHGLVFQSVLDTPVHAGTLVGQPVYVPVQNSVQTATLSSPLPHISNSAFTIPTLSAPTHVNNFSGYVGNTQYNNSSAFA